MKTIRDIFEMIDLFYANKHLYEKVKPHQEYMKKWRKEHGIA